MIDEPTYDRRHQSIEALRMALDGAPLRDKDQNPAAIPAPHPEAPALVYTWWIMRMVETYAFAVASQRMLGLNDFADGEAEVYCACISFGRRIEAQPALTAAAAKRAWGKAMERAEKFVTDLRFAIWPMGKSRLPGDAIIASAEKINDKHGCPLGPDDLLQAVRKFAHAACSGRRRNGRG